jgi:phosphomannomutase
MPLVIRARVSSHPQKLHFTDEQKANAIKKWPWMLRHFSIEKLYPSIAAKAQYLYAGGFWILARLSSTEPIVR